MAEQFVSTIEHSPLFQQSPLDGRKELVAHANGQVFLASGNVVRYSQINPKAQSYKVLSHKALDFNIDAVVLNHTGSRLVVHDSNHLVVVTLSKFVSGYHPMSIQNIKKVLWHPLNDNVVVVLTDRDIQVFDVRVLVVEPQAVVVLDEQPEFSGVPTTLAFGSPAQLAGALTLYLGSDRGVFALYPFALGEIKTTKTQVNEFYREVDTVASYAHTHFQGVETTVTGRFQEFAALLKHKSDQSEVESVLITTNTELPVVQKLLAGGIDDILSLPSRKTSALVALSGKELRYYVQDAALVGRWSQQSPSAPAKAPGYTKPTRGFGFVVSEPQPVVSTAEFYTHFSQLAAAGTTLLDTTYERLVSLSPSEFALVNTSVVYANASAWLNGIDRALSDVSLIVYKQVQANSDGLLVCLVADEVGATGQYLVIHGRKSFLKVQPLLPQPKKITSKKSLHNRPKTNETNLLKSTPFEANTVPPPTPLHLLLGASVDLSKLNHHVLKDVNAVSKRTLLAIMAYTESLLRIQARIDLQSQQLEHLITSFKKCPKLLADTVDAYTKRIGECSARQHQLQEKHGALRDRVVSQINELRRQTHTPLSRAERKWLQEINTITELTSKIAEAIGSLKADVHAARPAASDVDKVTRARVAQETSKIKHWLAAEGDLIDVAVELVKALSAR